MIQADANDDGIALSGEQDTLPKRMLDEAPSIDKLRRRFDESRQDTDEARRWAQRDRDYFDGPGQLNSETRTILELRKQPPIYTNRVRPAINGVLGVLEMGRRDPRGLPRNPDDQASADICTKTLRYINDESKFNDVQIDVAENFFIEGTGAVIVEVLETASKIAIVATQIRWEEFYYDPYSRRADLKDAQYMGIAKWLDADVVRRKWNVRINEIGDPFFNANSAGIWGDTWQDRPFGGMAWIDRKRNRVMLCEEYHRNEQGQWMRCIYIATGVLEYDLSPYKDEYGQPCNPIEAVSCYVDRENKRYGMVRDMVPIQDEINASRSRSLHLMNSRQVQLVNFDHPVASDTARTEAAKADGVLPPGYQIVATNDMTQANMLRNQEAKSEIERMGPTPAVLGRQEAGSQSGRARLVSQQAGLTELARPLGRLKAWCLRVYVQFWNRARQYWTDPMWIRVTDDLGTPDFMKVNEPVKFVDALRMAVEGDQQALQAVSQVVPPPVLQAAQQGDTAARAQLAQFTLQFGQQPIMVKGRLAELDMDIILDQDDDTATLQQEVWAELMELLRFGLSPFSPEFELVIQMSPLADKGKIVETLTKKREEMQQAQAAEQQAAAEQQQRAAQIGEATAIADIRNKDADTLVKMATAEEKRVDSTRSAIETIMAGETPEGTEAA